METPAMTPIDTPDYSANITNAVREPEPKPLSRQQRRYAARRAEKAQRKHLNEAIHKRNISPNPRIRGIPLNRKQRRKFVSPRCPTPDRVAMAMYMGAA